MDKVREAFESITNLREPMHYSFFVTGYFYRDAEIKRLRSALEGIVSCIGNPRSKGVEALDYAYKTAEEALND